MAGVVPAVRVIGLSRLTRTMREAEVSIEDLKDVNESIARLASLAIQAEAPSRSGRLRSSVRGNRAKGKAAVRVGGARIPYAGPIHWGWPSRPSHPTARGGPIPPNEFGLRAFDRFEPQAQRMYLEGIEKILNSVRGA